MSIPQQTIWIVDYGMGNLKSVSGAFEKFGVKVEVSSDPREGKKADKIVIPGVGAFGKAVDNLKNLGLFYEVKEQIQSGKVILGICLGMQILFETSEESEGYQGLSVVQGKVLSLKRLSENIRIPNMGWAKTRLKRNSIFDGLKEEEFFYYLHSYYVEPKDKESVQVGEFVGFDDEKDENIRFVSAIHQENIFAVQFHPEKSGRAGLKIVENFLKI
jgi:imidazole glycerol phosphate synthase, glutamine amidotransferase subunit